MIYKKIDLAECCFYNVSEDCAKGFIDWRIEIKKPLTNRAFKLAMIEAVRCGQLGLTPDESLDKTVLWGWQAPNYSYTARKIAEEFSAIEVAFLADKNKLNRSTRDVPILEQLNDRSWAE